MRLVYYKDPVGNFGDDLNVWIWDSLLPTWASVAPDVAFFGVGTLLNEDRLRVFRGKRVLVVGSGVGYGSRPPKLPLDLRWDIRAVRGPLSAKSLRLDPSKALVDPAVMVTSIVSEHSSQHRRGTVFVPHHRSTRRHDWPIACEDSGIRYISPAQSAHDVIRAIQSAELVIAEAMHAAIIADAFRVPWIPVRVGPQFNEFKWMDWSESVGLSATASPLFKASSWLQGKWRFFRRRSVERHFIAEWERAFLRDALLKALQMPSYLSDAAILEQKKEQLAGVLSEILADYA